MLLGCRVGLAGGGKLCHSAGLTVHPTQSSVASSTFPPKLNLPPHALLTHKDQKHEEAPEDVEGLGQLVEDKEGSVFLQLKKASIEQACDALQSEKIKPIGN